MVRSEPQFFCTEIGEWTRHRCCKWSHHLSKPERHWRNYMHIWLLFFIQLALWSLIFFAHFDVAWSQKCYYQLAAKRQAVRTCLTQSVYIVVGLCFKYHLSIVYVLNPAFVLVKTINHVIIIIIFTIAWTLIKIYQILIRWWAVLHTD